MNKLKDILDKDFNNNRFSKFSPIKKFLVLLRKTEHFKKRNLFLYFFYKIKLKFYSNKYLTFIPEGVADYGLSIAHLGAIYVNGSAKIGKNCRISQGVTIGSTSGKNEAPIIGDNVFIGPNVCIIGGIKIANDVCIGAGAVVVKDILEPGTTWGGVPAKKISNNNSFANLPIKNH